MQGGRAVGYGLLAGAGGITLLMLVWLAVSGAQGGGIVLGLLLLFVLAGPLAGAGAYVLSRQRVEAQAEALFAGKRRVLEADRTFRAELAAELRQVARRPGVPAGRLLEMAEDLERRAYDTAEWYDTVQLDDADLATLQRYDDLVWERARWLRENAGQVDAAALAEAERGLERALDQRRDLLLRGRRAPSIAASTLLRVGEPARGSDVLARLGLDDALSYDGHDYLVEADASYFAEGQTWKLERLAPSGAGATTRWLYVAPGGLSIALLDELSNPVPGAQEVTVEGVRLPLARAGTATVNVATKAGSARGVLVAYWRYAAEPRIAVVEQWPDGAVHAYAGQLIRPTDVQVWPAAKQVGQGTA